MVLLIHFLAFSLQWLHKSLDLHVWGNAKILFLSYSTYHELVQQYLSWTRSRATWIIAVATKQRHHCFIQPFQRSAYWLRVATNQGQYLIVEIRCYVHWVEGLIQQLWMFSCTWQPVNQIWNDLYNIPLQLYWLVSRTIPSGQAQTNPLGSLTLRRHRWLQFPLLLPHGFAAAR